MIRKSTALVIAILLVAGVFGGCKKKEAPPAPPPEPPPKPGVEYTDNLLQGAYVTAWQAALRNFATPEVGEYVWVQRADGAYVGGEIKSWSKDGVVFKDGTNELSVSRAEIAPDTLSELFADAFARVQALRVVETSRRAGLPVLKPHPMVGTVRYSISDSIPIRSGPGNRYAKVAVPDFSRGDMLEVLEEQNDWLRVKPRNKPAEFWLQKLATRPMPNAPPEDYSMLIASLMETGILASYAPLQSEARIPRGIWAGLHPGIREGLSRMLANHSMQTRKATTEWIEIKDSESGRKLARYSQAQGFRQP